MTKKILLVDDEPACTLFLGNFLSEEGYRVRASSTGIDAVQIAREFEPEILITDWMLKDEMNGLDVAEAILRLQPTAKIIFITGMSSDALEEKTSHIERAIIIEKPIELDYVARLLKELE